jgi:exodeoxyribonuclease VII small subunit
MPKTTPPAADAAPPVIAFESALDELEAVVQSLESGRLTLEESLAAYERGIGLYRQCQGALQAAELRVQQLADPLDPSSARDFPGDDD